MSVTVDFVFGEDDWVVGRRTATGTHTGTWGTLAPTGRSMSFSTVWVCRFENGKVAEILDTATTWA